MGGQPILGSQAEFWHYANGMVISYIAGRESTSGNIVKENIKDTHDHSLRNILRNSIHPQARKPKFMNNSIAYPSRQSSIGLCLN